MSDHSTEEDAFYCGHTVRQPGCGGCDPGAIEFIRDDGGSWRRYDEAAKRAACGVTFDHDWHGYLDDEGRTRVCDGQPTPDDPNPPARVGGQ